MNYWKKCNICKKEIPFSHSYYACSVSSCNSKRTGYAFCSIPCFDSHVPGARHKSAGAIEETSPKQSAVPTASREPQRRIVSGTSGGPTAPNPSVVSNNEILVVASRLKDFILKQSDCNTSASVMPALSEHLRRISLKAIDNARADGRKTVMDKDFKFLKNFGF